MRIVKKTVHSHTSALLSLVALLSFLLTTCGTSMPPGKSATPVPDSSASPSTPGQIDQNLIYTYEDSAHTWHVSRYNSRTGQKSDVYTTAAGQITEAQVSADGQWVLFLLSLYPAMRSSASARVQMIRINGQSLQILYSVPNGKDVGALEWSPDQRIVAFRESMDVYLLTVASRMSRLVVPAHGNQGFAPRTWLDATHLYLTLYQGRETPPLELYLLDSETSAIRQVLSLPTLGGDFDCSADGRTLFTAQYQFAMPAANGPSSIEAWPTTGGPASVVYRTPTDAITAVRVASQNSLLFLVHTTGIGIIDTSHNGLWRINTDGTGLRRLTSEARDELTLFPSFTQYTWSSISRDGSLYAVKVVLATIPNTANSLLIGSMNGGALARLASTNNVKSLEIAGWTTQAG